MEENGDGNYIIKAQIYDSQSGISQAKWTNGVQEAEYFTENGNEYNGNNYQFTGTADEIYTIYAKDNVGLYLIHLYVYKRQEQKSGKDYHYYKRLIIGALITGFMSAVI